MRNYSRFKVLDVVNKFRCALMIPAISGCFEGTAR
jgi:hypothetical protein